MSAAEEKRSPTVGPENYLAAPKMSVEQNYNQIDGIINNEAPKPPSALDTLRRCQEDAGRPQEVAEGIAAPCSLPGTEGGTGEDEPEQREKHLIPDEH